jgi:hypothetical protein
LIVALEGKNSPVLDLDRLSEEQLTELEERFHRWRQQRDPRQSPGKS